MAAEDDEVDIEGIVDGEDVIECKDTIENNDSINYYKKGALERSSSSFFSVFCDPSSWFDDPNSVLSLDHCADEKSRATIEKMILEEELYSHGYGRMLEVPTTPVSGTNKTASPSKKNYGSCKAKRCLPSETIPTTHRKPWTKEEQQLFEDGLEKHGRSWTKIASMIDSRTVLQVKNYANQYFKHREKSKSGNEDSPPTCGLNGTSEVCQSSLEDIPTNKTPIGNGSLVHIEKTSDEEDIEVDIDGDVENAVRNTGNIYNEVYEALLKSASDSQDSGSDEEEPGNERETTSHSDQSKDPNKVSMELTYDTGQLKAAKNITAEKSTTRNERNEFQEATMETPDVNQSPDEDKLLNLCRELANEWSEKRTDCKNDIKCSKCGETTTKDSSTNEKELSDVDIYADYKISTVDSASCRMECVHKTSTNRTPVQECKSIGQCTENTQCDFKRTSSQDSQMNLKIDRDEIHDLEKAWNKEFFMGRSLKTPSRYMKIRNYILDMWDKSKPNYLYKTSVRSGLKNCGDVNSIGRVHAFLEDIGAINAGCAERPRQRLRQTSETVDQAIETPAQMESWVNFLRPRKRRGKNSYGDWSNESAAEGLTIEHHIPIDDEEQKQTREKPAKRPKSTRKRASYNPFLLVPCQKFSSASAYPFAVVFQSDALVVIDIHSHLSTTEVIGLLGGTYCVTDRILKVVRVAPCKSLSTGMQCEMDPVSQTQASEELASIGLSVVGWYHSHPTFAPSPSVRDIETQGKFQEWFGKGGAPFVGVIASPYNYSNIANQSQITTLTVSNEWNMTDQYRLPYEFEYSIQDDATNWSTVMDCITKLETQYRCYEFRMPMTRQYSSTAFTALDKLEESIRPRLRGTEDDQHQFIHELRNIFTTDEIWSKERQERDGLTEQQTPF